MKTIVQTVVAIIALVILGVACGSLGGAMQRQSCEDKGGAWEHGTCR